MRKRKHFRTMMVWLLAAVLAVSFTFPAVSFADSDSVIQPSGTATSASGIDSVSGSTEKNLAAGSAEDPTEPLAAAPAYDLGIDPGEDPAVASPIDPTADPAIDSTDDPTADPTTDPTTDPTDPTTDPTTEATDPPAPKYVKVYRVKTTKSGKLRCYWYNAKGKRAAEPQKDRFFIIKFDKGSKTDGTAIKKVGKKGKIYYFNTKGNGKPYTGWFKRSGKKFYFKSGKRYRGTKKIEGIWYRFSKKNGKLQRKIGDDVDKKIQPWTSSTRYMIVVRLAEHRVRIYSGKKDNWIRTRTCSCTTGAPSTPTVRGTFSIGGKGLFFNTGTSQRCWYYTQFYGNYLFHSVIYDRSSSPIHVVDGRLGISASHGCIRLTLDNAKWIYNNIPRGTKVVVY